MPALASLHFYLLAAPANPLPASNYYSNALPESLYQVPPCSTTLVLLCEQFSSVMRRTHGRTTMQDTVCDPCHVTQSSPTSSSPNGPVLGLLHQMPLKPLGSTATTPTKPTASYPPTKYSSCELYYRAVNLKIINQLYHAYIPTTVLLLPTKLLHSYIPNQSLVQTMEFFA